MLLLAAATAYQYSFAQEAYEIGRFTIEFNSGANEEEQAIQDILIRDERLFELLAEIDDAIYLADGVQIIFAPWPDIARYAGWDVDIEPNAAHKDGVILISYGLIVDVINRFRKNGNFDDDNGFAEFDQKILPNIVETLLHEVGHALIYVNEMPTFDVGEEIIADQLAFFIMSELYEEEVLEPIIQNYTYIAAEQGAGMVSEDNSLHPGAGERAENLMCWIVGKWSFNDELESSEGLEECEYLYAKLMDEWHGRLAEWWRE